MTAKDEIVFIGVRKKEKFDVADKEKLRWRGFKKVAERLR